MKIFIDAGHGGSSVGAAYKGRKEQDDTLRLALRVKQLLLTQKGVEVRMSRETDTDISISERCSAANKWGANYFLSIHRNAAAKANTATGNEIWVVRKANEKTQYKASVILDSLCKADSLKNRGVKLGAPSYDNFGVNSLTTMASALLEVGFINNQKDNKVFDSQFESIALAIAKGIMEAHSKEFVLPCAVSGDANGDGKLTQDDALLALKMAVGLEKKDMSADINKDKKITPDDAAEILKMSAK